MPRIKGSGIFGVVRSLRLPRALDSWFEERLCERRESASELLLELVHGGLRLRTGYMSRHRQTLERLGTHRDGAAYQAYILALEETFGDAYVTHMLSWLEAEETATL